MAHAEAQEAQYKVIPADDPVTGIWKTPLALLIFLLAGVAGVFPPDWAAGAPLPSVQEGDLERGLRAAIYIQTEQVDVFRVRNDRLPDGLADLPVPLPGLSLVKSNNRVYQILGRRPGGEILVFDSAHPTPGFASTATGWAPREDAP